jgi:Flp pilus assembly secretin CpaC
MVRALAVCAVILAFGMASAQGETTPTVSEPTVAGTEASSASACDEHTCPTTTAPAASAEKPIDNHALLRQKLAELNCLQGEIDALRRATQSHQQILVQFKVLEVSRTKMRALGMDLNVFHGEANLPGQQAYSPEVSAQNAVFDKTDDGNALLGFASHLARNNIGKVLAEPKLVVLGGRPAQFHVGGEVPVAAGTDQYAAVEVKKVGTQLDVLATPLGNDRVRLDLRASVSELDHANSVNVAGKELPALKVRQVDSSLELTLGETGVLSGLVETRHESVRHSDGKVTTTPNEIELVFFVTPEEFASTNAEGGAPYRTAESASEVNPAERSLRVTGPGKSR